jgi:hypothetical protein
MNNWVYNSPPISSGYIFTFFGAQNKNYLLMKFYSYVGNKYITCGNFFRCL